MRRYIILQIGYTPMTSDDDIYREFQPAKKENQWIRNHVGVTISILDANDYRGVTASVDDLRWGAKALIFLNDFKNGDNPPSIDFSTMNLATTPDELRTELTHWLDDFVPAFDFMQLKLTELCPKLRCK